MMMESNYTNGPQPLCFACYKTYNELHHHQRSIYTDMNPSKLEIVFFSCEQLYFIKMNIVKE